MSRDSDFAEFCELLDLADLIEPNAGANKRYTGAGDVELDEAITHLKDLLSDPKHNFVCYECRVEHEKLLGWLMELREMRCG